jgi:hypothetical protein
MSSEKGGMAVEGYPNPKSAIFDAAHTLFSGI